MAKVTDRRLDKLERSSTDQDDFKLVLDWSGDELISSTDEIVISWDDKDGIDD